MRVEYRHQDLTPTGLCEPPDMDGYDPHDLSRFEQAQTNQYQTALSEIRGGHKQSHWIWFIFPQFDGLGLSATSRCYAIKSIAEAEAYLQHPVLGPRLVDCCRAAIDVNGLPAFEIFGAPDDMKLRSCARLFAHVSAPGSVFEILLDRFFDGEPDQQRGRPPSPVRPGALVMSRG